MDILINYGLKEDGETFEWWQDYPVDISKPNAFRAYRNHILKGFDIWEKNVLREREQDDSEVMAWYYLMLNFTNQITKDTTFDDYPSVPDKIKKYLGDE